MKYIFFIISLLLTINVANATDDNENFLNLSDSAKNGIVSDLTFCSAYVLIISKSIDELTDQESIDIKQSLISQSRSMMAAAGYFVDNYLVIADVKAFIKQLNEEIATPPNSKDIVLSKYYEKCVFVSNNPDLIINYWSQKYPL